MDVRNSSFIGFYDRQAFAVGNKIVYFGSNNKNTTFVLEKEEEGEKLEVVREDYGFDFGRGDWNTASCVLNNEIYAFKWGNYTEVHRYSLESGKWRLYYRK